MESQAIAIKKSVFVLLTGILIFLLAVVFVLYRNNNLVQKEYHQLIIQNDSLKSVNIDLMDSVK